VRFAALALLSVTLLAACAAGSVSPATAAAKGKTKTQASSKKPTRVPQASALGAGNVDRLKKAWEVAAGGYGRAVAVSSRLGRIAFANKEGVEIFALGNGKSLAKFQPCRDVVRGGLGFHAGNLVVVCEKAVVVLEAQKLGPRPDPGVHASRITAASLVGARLALGHHDGVIRVYGLDGSPTVEVRVPGPPIDVKSLTLSRDGSRLGVAWVQGSVWWWDLAKPAEFHDLVRNDKESDALAFSEDGSLLAEEGAANTTTLWELAPAHVAKAKLKNGNWVKRILFTRDGKWLVRGGSDGLELAELAGPRRIALDTQAAVEDVAFDEGGTSVAAVDREGRLTFWTLR